MIDVTFQSIFSINNQFVLISRQSHMEALAHICDFKFPKHVQFHGNFANESIYKTIPEISILFNETFKDCEWQNKHYNCSELFLPILNGDGLCYTFNSLNSKDFYTEE